jgi:hypothetical protein
MRRERCAAAPDKTQAADRARPYCAIMCRAVVGTAMFLYRRDCSGYRLRPVSFGHVAEWLRSGLQNRLPRFNSGRGLHLTQSVGTAPRISPLAASRLSVRGAFAHG